MPKWKTMAGRDCDHIGTLGSFAGSLGEVQLKPNIALGIFPLTLSFKIMLFSCFFLWWADTLFVHTHRNSGEGCMWMQSLCCHCCDIAAKRENFFLGSICAAGVGAALSDDNIQHTFFPLFTNRWWQREPLSCPKPAGQSNCISFKLPVYERLLYSAAFVLPETFCNRSTEELWESIVYSYSTTVQLGIKIWFPHCAGVMFSENYINVVYQLICHFHRMLQPFCYVIVS